MQRMSIAHIVSVIVGVLILYAAMLVAFEKKIVFYPVKYPSGIWDIASFGMKIEDVYFESGDGVKLHGWYVPSPGARATLLWFHGNAGNITHRLDNILRLQPLKLNIFIFDYRGYGRSAGEPDEKGIYLDSGAAYEYLTKTKNVRPENLFLFGRSLGGICAIEVASTRQARGLILESVFTSAGDMAKNILPFLPMRYFIRSRFNAIDKILAIEIPKLFFHGTEDEVVPYHLGRKLFDAAREPKEFHDIPRAGHNDTYVIGGKTYFETLDRFIQEHLPVSLEPESAHKPK